jgi:hypothetical protein
MDNYLLIQVKNGEIYLYKLSSKESTKIAKSDNKLSGYTISKETIVLHFSIGPDIITSNEAITNFIKLLDKNFRFQKLDFEVKTDGNSIIINKDKLLKWEKIHSYKGFYAKNEGYNRASISNNQKKIICERNWLGIKGFFNPTKYSNKTIVEIDINTEKETLICKDCSFPSYSCDDEYILYFKTDKQRYFITKHDGNYLIELDCIVAFWIF